MLCQTKYAYSPTPTLPKKIFLGKKLRFRYSFNGQERDDEIAGAGNIMTAEFWEYDTRLGRRWNLDPLGFEWQSFYAVLDNCPILKIDPRGLQATEPEPKEIKTPDGKWSSISKKLFDVKGDGSLLKNIETGNYFKYNLKNEDYERASGLGIGLRYIKDFFVDKISKLKLIWKNRGGFALGGGGKDDHASDAAFEGGKVTRVLSYEAINARSTAMGAVLGSRKVERPGDPEIINASNTAKDAAEKADQDLEKINNVADTIHHYSCSKCKSLEFDSISWNVRGKIISTTRFKNHE